MRVSSLFGELQQMSGNREFQFMQDRLERRLGDSRFCDAVCTAWDMPLGRAWLFTRGQPPEMVEKYDLREHPRYRELPESGGVEKEKGGYHNGYAENGKEMEC